MTDAESVSATEQEAMKMHEMEDEILATIGVGRIYGG